MHSPTSRLLSSLLCTLALFSPANLACSTPGTPINVQLIPPFQHLQLGRSDIPEVLASLGPGTAFLSSEEGEGQVNKNVVALQYDSAIQITGDVRVTAKLYLSRPSLTLQTLTLQLRDPVSLAELTILFGKDYSTIFCKVELLPGELEGVLVRTTEEQAEAKMFVYPERRLVVEYFDGNVQTLRFTSEIALEGDRCP